ncbi:AMP-binding protein [Marivibrio halodurans]|uniref:AMP-binding protein n=1 Tax=Marivibrio halodurans TaxID=2039722 RepID=A0A8J7S0A5_9PROT|nr:AMP-binding protein [Marivibrio halodurans]MBP5858002.1 AMP-binding protein [Marivibrio halodurans]
MELNPDGPTPTAPIDLPAPSVRVELVEGTAATVTGLPDKPPSFGSIAEWLDCAAVRTPDRPFLIAPGLSLSFDEVAGLTDGIAQALIDRDLGADRPLMIHGPGEPAAVLMQAGAVKAGVPAAIAPRAPARLAAESGPGLVYGLDNPAAQAVSDILETTGTGRPETVVGVRGVERIALTRATIEIMEARERTPPDRPYALYPASARAPSPHSVIASRRSAGTATASLLAAWPFAAMRHTVILTSGDPLDPGGAAAALRIAMAVGGTLILHAGQSRRGEIAALLKASGETGPTIIAEPAAALGHLLDAAEEDQLLADHLASRLEAVWLLDGPADAALAERLDRFGRRTRGERIALLDGLSLAETAGIALWRRADSLADRRPGVGVAGPGLVPLPGLSARAAGADGGGLCLRGAAVGPGWFGASEEESLWDGDGFRRTGAGLRLVEAGAPDRGFLPA